MVAIQVRDVSPETRDALADEAGRRGQSLQAFLHDMLEREAASARNIAWVLSKRSAQRPPDGRSTTGDEIRRLNEEHTARILAAFDERHR